MNTRSFLSLAGLPLVIAACGSADSEDAIGGGEAAVTGAGAVAGVPVLYLGTVDIPSGRLTFDNGHSEDQATILSRGNFGPIAGTGGYAAARPLDCHEVESWVTDSPRLPAGTLCAAEYVGTGRSSETKNGTAMHIIPLGSSGTGFNSATYREAVHPLAPGAEQPVAAGPPTSPNMSLDRGGDYVLRQMINIAAQFRTVGGGVVASGTQDCLKNARTAGWGDLQSHYYCLFPYTIRYCYSTTLSETRSPARALAYCSDAANADDWRSRFEPRFHAFAPGHADWDWLKAQDGLAIFKYVMFTAPGKADFNIESENEIIDGFYTYTRSPRPRRAVDTYPSRSTTQPRYEALRCAQAPGTPGCT